MYENGKFILILKKSHRFHFFQLLLHFFNLYLLVIYLVLEFSSFIDHIFRFNFGIINSIHFCQHFLLLKVVV